MQESEVGDLVEPMVIPPIPPTVDNQRKGIIQISGDASSFSAPESVGVFKSKKDNTREKLAMSLLYSTTTCIVLSLFITSWTMYVMPDKIEFKDIISLVQTVCAAFSGLLGAAIAFYFSDKQ